MSVSNHKSNCNRLNKQYSIEVAVFNMFLYLRGFIWLQGASSWLHIMSYVISCPYRDHGRPLPDSRSVDPQLWIFLVKRFILATWQTKRRWGFGRASCSVKWCGTLGMAVPLHSNTRLWHHWSDWDTKCHMCVFLFWLLSAKTSAFTSRPTPVFCIVLLTTHLLL